MTRILRRLPPFLAVTVAILALTATTAKAGLVLTGNIVQVIPPPSVALGADENDVNAIVFQERSGYSFPTNIAVNFLSPGTANTGNGFSPSPGSLGPGTSADVYFVHADPVRNGPETYSGTLTFDSQILGIIDTSSLLDKSDSTLGFPGTTYPTGLSARGLEGSDSVIWMISPNDRTVSFHFETTGAVDEFRVLVAPVPEPSSLIAGATAGILLTLYGWRRWRHSPSLAID